MHIYVYRIHIYKYICLEVSIIANNQNTNMLYQEIIVLQTHRYREKSSGYRGEGVGVTAEWVKGSTVWWQMETKYLVVSPLRCVQKSKYNVYTWNSYNVINQCCLNKKRNNCFKCYTVQWTKKSQSSCTFTILLSLYDYKIKVFIQFFS